VHHRKGRHRPSKAQRESHKRAVDAIGTDQVEQYLELMKSAVAPGSTSNHSSYVAKLMHEKLKSKVEEEDGTSPSPAAVTSSKGKLSL